MTSPHSKELRLVVVAITTLFGSFPSLSRTLSPSLHLVIRSLEPEDASPARIGPRSGHRWVNSWCKDRGFGAGSVGSLVGLVPFWVLVLGSLAFLGTLLFLECGDAPRAIEIDRLRLLN